MPIYLGVTTTETKETRFHFQCESEHMFIFSEICRWWFDGGWSLKMGINYASIVEIAQSVKHEVLNLRVVGSAPRKIGQKILHCRGGTRWSLWSLPALQLCYIPWWPSLNLLSFFYYRRLLFKIRILLIRIRLMQSFFFLVSSYKRLGWEGNNIYLPA